MTSAEQEDWVARRESYTAGLVRRAILQPGVQDGVNVPAARNMSKTLQVRARPRSKLRSVHSQAQMTR